MASLTTGTRHISGRGNVGTNLAWTLRNLDPGIYYWAVQALDHTYSGSVFSDEDTFYHRIVRCACIAERRL